MTAPFDRIVVVDWSASATPTTGRDSIWSDVFRPATGEHSTTNHRTRHDALRYLVELLDEATGRVLIGFDFPFGFPTGFARSAGLTGATAWQATWQHLVAHLDDRPDNSNNRFEVASQLNAAIGDGPGPFWGTTSERHVTPWLSRRKAPGFPHGRLEEFRHNERAVRATGRFPFSVWQLSGAGSVGSQALTGIPVVHALRHHPSLADRATIWPFESGFTHVPGGDRDDAIVIAEVWPSAIPLDADRHPVRDAAQVIGLGEHLARLDATGDLAPLFAPVLDEDVARVVLAEEGWMLGAQPGQPTGRSPM